MSSTELPTDPEARRAIIAANMGLRPSAPTPAKHATKSVVTAPLRPVAPKALPVSSAPVAEKKPRGTKPKPEKSPTETAFIRNIAPETYERVHTLALREKRTVNAQWLWIVEQWLAEHASD